MDEAIRDISEQQKLRAELLMTLDPAAYRFGAPHDEFRESSDALYEPIRNAIHQWGGPSYGGLSIYEKDLDFYRNDVRLFYVIDHGSEPPVRHLLLNYNEQLHEMKSSGAAVHGLNEAMSFAVSESNVADYLRFYFSVIRFSSGRLLLIENPDDIHWQREAGDEVRRSARKFVLPLELRGRTDDGHWRAVGSFLSGSDVLRTEIVVRPDGAVSLRSEEALLRDVPVKADVREFRDGAAE